MNAGPEIDVASADGQDRYVPSGKRDRTSASHEGVYEWIAENLVKEGMKALDLGCGTGYGVARLADAGATVDGADSSPAAIAYAIENFAGPGVRFFVADVVKPLPDVLAPQSYDLVVSSEVLEHVVDPFVYVQLMADSLCDDGVCFVGTPNRLWSKDNLSQGRLHAPSHLMEFTPPALIALLRTAFDEVSLMVRLFPDWAIHTEPAAAGWSRPRVIRGAAAFARTVAPSAYRRLRDKIGPAPVREWVAADIVWAGADNPAVDMGCAAGLAAVCHRPRRVGR
jgi:SAM-dependent methyltransferase